MAAKKLEACKNSPKFNVLRVFSQARNLSDALEKIPKTFNFDFLICFYKSKCLWAPRERPPDEASGCEETRKPVKTNPLPVNLQVLPVNLQVRLVNLQVKDLFLQVSEFLRSQRPRQGVFL